MQSNSNVSHCRAHARQENLKECARGEIEQSYLEHRTVTAPVKAEYSRWLRKLKRFAEEKPLTFDSASEIDEALVFPKAEGIVILPEALFVLGSTAVGVAFFVLGFIASILQDDDQEGIKIFR